MALNVEIVSSEIIKPSSPTPDHLKNFKICLLDELAPPSYNPVLLFFSSSELGCENFPSKGLVSEKLKMSLSKTLTKFYPFAGKVRGTISVECNDEGALYKEARVSIAASEIVKNMETSVLYKLFPFDPYRVRMDEVSVITGVQVNFFECGSVGIGICLWHKIVDGATMMTFLNDWAATANGLETFTPFLDSAAIFPPKGIDLIKQSDMTRDEKVVTKVFEFSGHKLANLKAKVGISCNATRVEAATALIWKCAMEAAKANSGKDSLPPSIVTHLVNIRERMDPPLPENSIGNLWRLTLAPYIDTKHEVELSELASILRKSIQKVDKEYVSNLQGEGGLAKAIEPLKEMRELAMGGVGGVEVYTFSSWTRFPLYEIDFGWGKPTRVCTLTVPVRNCVILMGTKLGDGVEAWVTLTENDMMNFQRNDQLLQFVGTS